MNWVCVTVGFMVSQNEPIITLCPNNEANPKAEVNIHDKCLCQMVAVYFFWFVTHK